MLTLAGCAQKEIDPSKLFQIYYINNSETKLEMREYEMVSVSPDGHLAELIECLSTTPEKLEYKAPFSFEFELKSYELVDEKLTIDMNEAYYKLSPTNEVLIRAAIVKTLTQVSNVTSVSFTVEGEPLFDTLGIAVGAMNAEQFVNNESNDIHGYEKIQLKLYFANEDGDSLIEVKRNKTYNTNISLEKLALEELIMGPGEDTSDVYPTINPETKLASSVLVKDGICYVNLNENFLTQPYNVSADVAIYSIVNTLVELPNVYKVQISINGETTATYGEKYNLSTIFERNLDLITTLD